MIGLAVLALLVTAHVDVAAQEAAAEGFTPPRAHPVERYEAGWRKNPFVLKTAPVTPERVSFARDWIIAGCFGKEGDPSVIVANTKTHERIRLKKGEPAANGMVLHSVTFKSSRKETEAQVALGSETALLRFDESYLKQSRVQQKSHVAGAVRRPSHAPGELPAASPGPEPVASMPTDKGSGFPNAYGNGDNEAGAVASLEDGSPPQGRRRLLTAQKPPGGGK